MNDQISTELIKSVSESVRKNITIDVCHGTAMVTITDNFGDDSIVLSDEGLDLNEDAKELYKDNGEITMEEALYFIFSNYSEIFA